MTRRIVIGLVLSAAVAAGISAPAAAEARPVRFDQPQAMPDGSVRYGTGAASVTMTIRNPCPPGDIEHEMMALRSLPGRGRK